MSRQPKYPHVPKRREPLYPHRPARDVITQNLLDAQPLFAGKGYRVDIENWGIPDKATAGDVVRFEEEELDNRLGVPPALVKELDKYHHSDVIWVTKKREDAKHYLSEGMTEADISEIDVGAGARIIADDGGGGYLVLRGGAQQTSSLEAIRKNWLVTERGRRYQDLQRFHGMLTPQERAEYNVLNQEYMELGMTAAEKAAWRAEGKRLDAEDARDLAEQEREEWTDDDRRKVLGGGPGAAPMFDRKRHQHGDKRTVFYIQYWSPKSDPEISQPYYHSGPEEGGTYKDLNQALRAAGELQRARADAFDISIYSRVETWVEEEEDPRYGYWEPVDETVKGYDLRGKLVYDETA